MICRNCSSNNIELFHSKVWSMDNGKVYKCCNCELLFIDPVMNEDEEKEFYNSYNENVKKRGGIVESSIIEFHNTSINTAKERLTIVQEYFNNNKVLEIGSSTGAFLSILNANVKTYACELNKDNLQFSKQFINGNIFSSIDDINETGFDIICMFHVFEHIREPKSFLNKCRSLLNNGGYIIIEVPHSNDPLISLYNLKDFKDFVFQPMHPMIYNEKSLDYIFTQSGFTKEEVIYHQRFGLDNHLSWFKNKKQGGDKYLQELFSSNIEYKAKLESIKKTDTIFYISRYIK